VRHGLKKCGACRKQFTVRVGTVFESSHVPLHIWLRAIAVVTSSKKGISSNQLSRVLGVTLKTAWFMSHRIREAMRSGDMTPFGGEGTPVEVDETNIGTIQGAEVKRGGYMHKHKVLSLVDRATGAARSYAISEFKLRTVAPILDANIAREARLMTDEAIMYKHIGWNFADHGVVNHGRDEYVSRQDGTIHTNTIEGFFSVFKRGMKGVYQHCEGKHLHRYMAEFDFRYSNRVALGVDDHERADRALKGIVGKRLTYRRPDGGAEAALCA
jgi:hypothetical protein